MKKRRVLKVLLAVLILIIIAILGMIIFSIATKDRITVSSYELDKGMNDDIRIVQISDLHDEEFGEENADLVNLIKQQEPDIIAMTGDMIDNVDSDLDNIRRLIEDLTKVAPVYYCFGNHEDYVVKEGKEDIREYLEDSGAVVFEAEYADLVLNGNDIRIGGYMGYWNAAHLMTADENKIESDNEFFEEFEKTDRIKILLNHIPTAWADWEYIDKCDVDLVLSGHYHGGQIRIPFIDRGVYAPYVGWFPPYTKGIYEGKKATCIISAGLGTYHNIPRINNPAEIVVVDIK